MKVIEIDVPAGVHEVRVIFAPTWDRRIGAPVSLGAATVLLGLCLWAMNRKRLQSEAKG